MTTVGGAKKLIKRYLLITGPTSDFAMARSDATSYGGTKWQHVSCVVCVVGVLARRPVPYGPLDGHKKYEER